MHSIRKTVPATELPVSLADAKAHCRIAWDDDDELLAAMMGRVAEEIEAACGIPLGVCGYAQTVDGFPDYGPLTLGRRPLVALTGVTYADADGVPRTLDPSNYFTALRTGRVVAKEPFPATEIGRPEAVELTFTAGIPAATLPAQITAAFLLTLMSRFDHRGDDVLNTNPAADMLALPPAAVMLLRQVWHGNI